MKEGTPIFVKIEEYKDVLDTINAIKMKLTDAKDVLSQLSDLKAQEDAEIENWKSELEDVERKMNFIDSSLFEEEL